MSTATDVRTAPTTAPATAPASAPPARRLVLYGDFNCPWSYLASRRAALLAETGTEVDWRAVEHDAWRPRPFSDSSLRFDAVRDELRRIEELLLPGELFPHALAGFVPFSRASVSAYAEAYGAGVAGLVRQLLFEAFWVHGTDLGDPKVVRTLLVDAIRSGHSASEPLREWGYAVDVTGGPVTTAAWRLVGQWEAEWQQAPERMVPLLYVDDGPALAGAAALEWLGRALTDRGVDVSHDPRVPLPRPRPTDRAPLSWVSQHGNRWMRDFQAQHQPATWPHAS